jgi:hypothetical protein
LKSYKLDLKVESERAFSITGQFATKLRTKLDDDTLSSLVFQTNIAMATLGLKKIGKFLWEGKEKGLPCWVPQFSKTKRRQPTEQTFFPYLPKGIFPVSSNLR